MERITLPGAAEKATAIFTSIAESRWDVAAEGFSPAVRKALGPTGARRRLREHGLPGGKPPEPRAPTHAGYGRCDGGGGAVAPRGG